MGIAPSKLGVRFSALSFLMRILPVAQPPAYVIRWQHDGVFAPTDLALLQPDDERSQHRSAANQRDSRPFAVISWRNPWAVPRVSLFEPLLVVLASSFL